MSSSSPRRSGDTLVRSRTSGDPFDCSGMDGMQLATELQRRSDASNAGGDSSSSSSSTGDDEAEEQVLVILPAAIHQKHAAAAAAAAAADTVGNAPGASGSVPAMRCAVCLGHGTVDQYLLRGILV